MRFRNAVKRDADVLTALALRSKGHWGYPASFLDRCRGELTVTPEDLENETAHYVVAETDGVVTGFYGVTQTDGESCELEALFVEPSLIGTGIGRLLLQNALQEAFNRGGSALVVQSDPNAGLRGARNRASTIRQHSWALPAGVSVHDQGRYACRLTTGLIRPVTALLFVCGCFLSSKAPRNGRIVSGSGRTGLPHYSDRV